MPNSLNAIEELKKELEILLKDFTKISSDISFEIALCKKRSDINGSSDFNLSRLRKVRVATVRLEKISLRIRALSKQYELVAIEKRQQKRQATKAACLPTLRTSEY
jgi:hypothetical protein